MSHIKNIEIKNFKSIRHAKIEDCRRVNVFIGYPNVGKSNILEAMSLFCYLNDDQELPLKSYIRFKEIIDLFSDGDKQKDSEIFTNSYVVSLRYIDKNTLECAFVNAENYVENFNADTAKILKFVRFNKDGGISQSNRGQYKIDSKSKKYHFKSEGGFIYANPDQRVLDYPFGSNLSEVIRYNSSLRRECGELFSKYGLKLIFDENGSIVVQKQLDEFSAFQFSFLQVADTLQRLIFHKAAIVTNANAILLFEEPEAHMFPPYISKFTTDVMLDKNNNQFFISTHSPFVLNDFMEDMEKGDLAIYAVGYLNGETTISRLTDKQVTDIYQYGVDLFFNLEEFLKDVVS